MSSVFGGSKSKSSSSNQAYNTINNWASPLLGYAQQGASGLSALLGGDTSGLQSYRDATGFNDTLAQGLQDTTNASAAKGLLRSGAATSAATRYANQTAQDSANSYMRQLLGLAGLGSNAASILSGAGGTSTSSSKSKKGVGEMLGTAASVAAASDRRLKTNIKKVGELDDGLGVYEYNYIWDKNKTITGVMADEVEKLRPWALGPKLGEYSTVYYGRL